MVYKTFLESLQLVNLAEIQGYALVRIVQENVDTNKEKWKRPFFSSKYANKKRKFGRFTYSARNALNGEVSVFLDGIKLFEINFHQPFFVLTNADREIIKHMILMCEEVRCAHEIAHEKAVRFVA